MFATLRSRQDFLLQYGNYYYYYYFNFIADNNDKYQQSGDKASTATGISEQLFDKI